MTRDQSDLTPTIRDVVFAHIPKTAGTSMRKALVNALPDSFKFFDYGADITDVEGDFANAAQFKAEPSESIIALRRKLQPGRAIFVSGHFQLREYLDVFHPASFITFLRDPVERVISAYKHYARHMDFTGPFSDFYQMRQHINNQSRILWDIDMRSIGFIGLTEHMPEMVEALSRHLGARLKIRSENVSSGQDGPAVTPADRAKIIALNNEDVRLYQHVKTHLAYYTDFRGRKEMIPIFARGGVKHQGGGVFRGWVLTSEPGRLAEIEVKVGARVVRRCYADQYRPAKAVNEAALNRRWGFSVTLPAELLNGPDPVRFVLAGTERDLAGSPVDLKAGTPQPQADEPAELAPR